MVSTFVKTREKVKMCNVVKYIFVGFFVAICSGRRKFSNIFLTCELFEDLRFRVITLLASK